MVGIDLETAIDLLLKQVKAAHVTESVSLLDGVGRVIADDVWSPSDNPPFDRSPLDGYTFIAEATATATKEMPAKLEIVGEVCAGHVFEGKVEMRQAVRIMTGAPIPFPCDCVVRQEDVQADGKQLWITKPMQHHENYCFQGEDFKAKTLLVSAGSSLTAAHIATLASIGQKAVTVYKRIKVAICSTGDELVDVGESLAAGKIYNSNLYLLAARLKELGVEPVVLGMVEDRAESVAAVIQAQVREADLILTTGGVSVGKKDIMHDVIACLPAKRLFWRVNMKPGTPILSYVYQGKLCIGLSGNPFAALATFELLVRPVMAKLSCKREIAYTRIPAILQDDFLKRSAGRRFIRAKYAEGKVYLPSENHSSGSLFSAVGCNALIDISPGTPAIMRGTEVEIIKL